ncbi:hypothetical protein A2U01_0042492, partial [Trifolium medium]|nr:hypothetical protein [Trifolium medium]
MQILSGFAPDSSVVDAVAARSRGGIN